MPSYIILRLVPSAPIAPATFTTYLTNLTITAYDVSYAHPDAGTAGDPTPPIGSATYGAPTGISTPPPILQGGPYNNYPAGTTIAQHFSVQTFLGIETGLTFESVATAVIQLNEPAGYTQYMGPDLRLHLDWGGGVPTVIDPNVFYSLQVYTAAGLPSPDYFQNFQPADSAVSLPSSLIVAPIAAYVTLPAPPNPAVAQLQLPTNGNPPDFADLLAAVTQVLTQDPGGGTAPSAAVLANELAYLSLDQCRNLAYEIIWGPQYALPDPASTQSTLEQMYSYPPNTGSNASSNTPEQSLQQFQGDLNSYYSTYNAQAEQLTGYVFALAAAVNCEQQSQQATQAALEFPVDPAGTSTLATVSEAEVVLVATAGNPLNFNVPAAYFYALGVQLPTRSMPRSATSRPAAPTSSRP